MHLHITMLLVFSYMALLAISKAYVNVALNKPAYQQYQFSPGDDRYDASNAVDGRKSDLSLGGGQCAASFSRQTATWWVILTRIHSIHHITIFFMTNNDDSWYRREFSSYILGFSVFVSNTTDRLQGTLCFKDDNFTKNTMPTVFTANCYVHGQYVIYYNERLPGVVYPDGYDSYVGSFLCEVEVYVNVALNKPAYQQYQYISGDDRYDASNAVDGRKSDLSLGGGQCSASYSVRTATWWVNLTRIHSIHHITIYFMTNNDDSSFRAYLATFLLGFSVYVSNTTDISQGTLCFKDNNFTINTIPPVFTTNCFVHGQYVIYYNERLPGVVYPDGYNRYVAIVLCEVEVYGCDNGPYGFDCKEKCGNCRDIDQCFYRNGTCLTGCDGGYQGDLCKTQCDIGSYGTGCNELCGYCRDVSQCSNINGTCFTGCEAGFEGDLCTTQCDKGWYGIGCSETCGHCRDVNQCFHINGTCLTGCDTGYKGDLCKTECDSGFYGVSCNETCENCRDICDHVNGTCLTGCLAGYIGNRCQTQCDKGSYGIECNETCGHCRDVKQCSNVNGSCLTGCDDSYEGDLCKSRE